MNIQDLKLKYVKRFSQIVVFTRDGEWVSSCDSLIDTTSWRTQSIYKLFPLIASLEEPIRIMDQGARPICLPAIEMSLENRPGVFDFEFYAHPEDENLRVWMIFDQTPFYRYLQEIQQERNVLRMEKEDLLNQRNIDRRIGEDL